MYCFHLGLLFTALVAGCTGTIVSGDDTPSRAGGQSGRPGLPVQPNQPPVDEDGKPLPVSEVCKDARPSFLPTRVWPLTGAQYEKTVLRLFGLKADGSGFARAGVTNDGISAFDTNAAAAFLGPQTVGSLETQSGLLAKSLVPLARNKEACLAASSIPRDCVDRVVEHWATLAFRRPVDNDERTRFGDFASASITAHGADAGVRMFFEALLQSPRFLYRSEIGEAVSTAEKTRRLSAHEVASQLSYMLTDNAPDGELMADASADRLGDRTVLLAHARRLMQDPVARTKVNTFMEQLYHLAPVMDGTIQKNSVALPGWSDGLRTSMVKETRAYLDHHLWQKKSDLKGFFAAEESFVDAKMAAFYGLSATGLSDTAQLRSLTGARRRGLLGQAAILSAISGSQATSPVHRGLFFYQSLLCQTVPTPPAGAATMAAKIVSPDPEATQKEHFAYAQKAAPECVNCHALFMPMGFTLEHFDAIGQYRETQYGKALDVTVTVEEPAALAGNYPDAFTLADAVAASDVGQQCFARNYMTYALGRGFDPDGEACAIEPVFRRFVAAGAAPADLALALVQDDTFFFRDGSNL